MHARLSPKQVHVTGHANMINTSRRVSRRAQELAAEEPEKKKKKQKNNMKKKKQRKEILRSFRFSASCQLTRS